MWSFRKKKKRLLRQQLQQNGNKIGWAGRWIHPTPVITLTKLEAGFPVEPKIKVRTEKNDPPVNGFIHSRGSSNSVCCVGPSRCPRRQTEPVEKYTVPSTDTLGDNAGQLPQIMCGWVCRLLMHWLIFQKSIWVSSSGSWIYPLDIQFPLFSVSWAKQPAHAEAKYTVYHVSGMLTFGDVFWITRLN